MADNTNKFYYCEKNVYPIANEAVYDFGFDNESNSGAESNRLKNTLVALSASYRDTAAIYNSKNYSSDNNRVQDLPSTGTVAIPPVAILVLIIFVLLVL